MIFNTLSYLASVKTALLNFYHSKVNILYAYNTTQVGMYLRLIFQILASYDMDHWQMRFYLQFQAKQNLALNAATLIFILGLLFFPDTKSYFALWSEANRTEFVAYNKPLMSEPLTANSARLFYHINGFTSIYRLYIPLSVTPVIFATAHKEKNLGLVQYNQIIS